LERCFQSDVQEDGQDRDNGERRSDAKCNRIATIFLFVALRSMGFCVLIASRTPDECGGGYSSDGSDQRSVTALDACTDLHQKCIGLSDSLQVHACMHRCTCMNHDVTKEATSHNVKSRSRLLGGWGVRTTLSGSGAFRLQVVNVP
jgi:hypothetical protein